jgi:hypothetical protein
VLLLSNSLLSIFTSDLTVVSFFFANETPENAITAKAVSKIFFIKYNFKAIPVKINKKII